MGKHSRVGFDTIAVNGPMQDPGTIAALQKAWDGEGFRCYYSGIRLNESDSKNPRYLTFDHRIPRQEDDVE